MVHRTCQRWRELSRPGRLLTGTVYCLQQTGDWGPAAPGRSWSEDPPGTWGLHLPRPDTDREIMDLSLSLSLPLPLSLSLSTSLKSYFSVFSLPSVIFCFHLVVDIIYFMVEKWRARTRKAIHPYDVRGEILFSSILARKVKDLAVHT